MYMTNAEQNHRTTKYEKNEMTMWYSEFYVVYKKVNIHKILVQLVFSLA